MIWKRSLFPSLAFETKAIPYLPQVTEDTLVSDVALSVLWTEECESVVGAESSAPAGAHLAAAHIQLRLQVAEHERGLEETKQSEVGIGWECTLNWSTDLLVDGFHSFWCVPTSLEWRVLGGGVADVRGTGRGPQFPDGGHFNEHQLGLGAQELGTKVRGH